MIKYLLIIKCIQNHKTLKLNQPHFDSVETKINMKTLNTTNLYKIKHY